MVNMDFEMILESGRIPVVETDISMVDHIGNVVAVTEYFINIAGVLPHILYKTYHTNIIKYLKSYFDVGIDYCGLVGVVLISRHYPAFWSQGLDETHDFRKNYLHKYLLG